MSINLKVTIILSLIILVFSHNLKATRIITLSEAINIAVGNDPEIKAAKRNIQISHTKRSQAKLRYLPKLEFGLTQSPQVDYYGQPVINNKLWNSYIGIEQSLYKGGTIRNSVKLADSEISRGKLERKIYHQRISIEVTKAYFQSLSTQGMVEQYQTLLQQEEEDLREAQIRLNSGTGSKMDVLEVSTRILDVQQKLSKAKSDHQMAMTELIKVLGMEDEEDIRLAEGMPISDINGNFETLLSEAKGTRPELKYLLEDFNYNQLKTEIEKGKQKPQLSLVAYHEWQSPVVFEANKNFGIFLKASFSWGNTTLSFQESRNQIYPNAYAYPRYPGAPPLSTYYFPVRSIKYSIFDNSSNKVELQKARSDQELARDRWVKEKQNLAEELRNTMSQKMHSSGRIEMAKKQIVLAEELLDISRTKYRTGMVTISEVLKARVLLAEARINLLDAQKDFAVSLAQLYMMLGRDLLGFTS